MNVPERPKPMVVGGKTLGMVKLEEVVTYCDEVEKLLSEVPNTDEEQVTQLKAQNKKLFEKNKELQRQLMELRKEAL